MQLQFSVDETQLVIEILERHGRQLVNEIAHTDRSEFRRKLNRRRRFLDELENKLIRNELDLSAEELEALARELETGERELVLENARTTHRDLKHALLRKERLLDKVCDQVGQAYTTS